MSTIRFMRRAMRGAWIAAITATLSAATLPAQDFLSGDGPRKAVRVDQRLNAPVPLDLKFRDESGKIVRLGEYFGSRPVILNFAYYECPMLCSVVLDGIVNTIADIKLVPGKDYEIITVSFDPRDTPSRAAEKKAKYVRRYGRPGAAEGWHFLTGDQKSIGALTNAVGFRYAWDEKIQQFAHGSMIAVLTPQGKIARYFYGIDFRPRDVRLGLVEASDNKIGSPTDEILLLCYKYDPATGTYSAIAMNVVRAGSFVTILGLGGFVVAMLRREKKNQSARGGGSSDR